MPERGRHHQRSDDYARYKNRDRDYSHNAGHSVYDSRDHNQKPIYMNKRGSAGDRRAKESSQRDVTTASHEESPAYRGHNHQGPSRL